MMSIDNTYFKERAWQLIESAREGFGEECFIGRGYAVGEELAECISYLLQACAFRPDLALQGEAGSPDVDVMFRDLELALFGKVGNTWEQSRHQQVRALLARWQGEAGSQAQQVQATVDRTLRCMTCGTAAHQPNPRCENHISSADRLQTEVEMHNACPGGLPRGSPDSR